MTSNVYCVVCGNLVTRWVKSKNQWWKWCSNKCMSIDPDIVFKKQQTNLVKFGGHPMHCLTTINKLKITNLTKFGVENPFANSVVKNKIQQTNLQKYGTKNPSNNKNVIDKIKKKAIDRYKNQKSEILEKRLKTNMERYGVYTNKLIHISTDTNEKMNDIEWLKIEHINNKKPIEQIAEELNISPTPLFRRFAENGIPINRYSESRVQKDIIDFIKSISTEEIIVGERTICYPKEIDIYLPNKKLAIEVDGIYWHCESLGKDSQYHLTKTKQCEEKGIHLLHIYDVEWNSKKEIIKSKICHLLGFSKKIFARKTSIKQVSYKDAKNFLDCTHIQGYCSFKENFGLYLNQELVALATFSKTRFSKKYEWELVRYSSKLHTTVVGGIQKLLKHFTKEFRPVSLVSYADRRWTCSLKNVYNTIGFKKISESKPNYKYFKKNKSKMCLYSRNAYQKHLLSTKLDYFDAEQSEYQNMLNNGYERIWDCGNLVFVITQYNEYTSR